MHSPAGCMLMSMRCQLGPEPGRAVRAGAGDVSWRARLPASCRCPCGCPPQNLPPSCSCRAARKQRRRRQTPRSNCAPVQTSRTSAESTPRTTATWKRWGGRSSSLTWSTCSVSPWMCSPELSHVSRCRSRRPPPQIRLRGGGKHGSGMRKLLSVSHTALGRGECKRPSSSLLSPPMCVCVCVCVRACANVCVSMCLCVHACMHVSVCCGPRGQGRRGRRGAQGGAGAVDGGVDSCRDSASGAWGAASSSESGDAEPRVHVDPDADPGDLEMDFGPGSRGP